MGLLPTLTRREQTVVVPPAQQQYALVVLNDAQVSQLLGQPPMKSVNRPLLQAHEAWDRYDRLKRRVAIAVTGTAMIALGAAAWAWAPRPALAPVMPWSRPAVPPTVPTAASFSVTVASPRSADSADWIAGQVRGLGLPAFTRRMADRGGYQVLAGPYVSLDEAESVQQLLGMRGYGATRLFVDEQLRDAPRNDIRPASVEPHPGVLLVGAPDRVSLVLELAAEPRHVSSRRVSDTMMDIDVGPVPNRVDAQQWSAPAGVDLVRHVAFEEVNGPGNDRFLRAHVSLPEFAHANVRVEGPRVYLDLTLPQNAPGPAVPAPAPVAAPAARAGQAVNPAPAPARPDLLQPVIGRFEQTVPFLLSASRTPTPDVLAALDRTLASMQSALAAVPAADRSPDYDLMATAVATARDALGPGFAGDRAERMRQAVAFFEGVRAEVRLTPAAQ